MNEPNHSKLLLIDRFQSHIFPPNSFTVVNDFLTWLCKNWVDVDGWIDRYRLFDIKMNFTNFKFELLMNKTYLLDS